MALKNGDKAPDFTLPGTSGENFELSGNLPCIIYFYPKDFTRGCTEQACSFRDGFTQLRDLNINVYGISRDAIHTHLKFQKKLNLPFELLSDTQGKYAKAMMP